MTSKLILIRHGKSGWDDDALDDYDRTLTDRGRTDAAAIGAWLRAQGHAPDVILCSSAQRTRETATALDLPGTLTLVDALYLASSDQLLRHIAKQTAATIAVIAHNPGIGDLATRLAHQPPTDPRFGSYPTSATTVLTFDAPDWSSITTGICTAFVTPRSLNA
ncbi:hypothetical protein AN189_17225 [Loktanella sp. 3ANDIMAR09]|uniref:SixA phosphatase family protein n=1 Tax=Loktanella sp. 3ANDIMAR09 TaxID=1225657 RepID=UPI0006FD5012|nr:histidine phosphatase family protein [Loktanella sp. 3ANDIMAR09]KQI67093.1 hypothetical protein AN189_17225 [Loktanella sp. 3ANDIMAR09]